MSAVPLFTDLQLPPAPGSSSGSAQSQSFELSLTEVILHQTSPQVSQSAGSEAAPLTFAIQSREMNSDIPLAGQCVGLGYLAARPSNIYSYKVNF